MKQIRSTAPDIHQEKISSFVRDDDGFFRKIEKTIYRDRENNQIKQGEEVMLDGLYRITLEDDFDDEVSYQGIDGKDQTMRFKLVGEQN